MAEEEQKVSKAPAEVTAEEKAAAEKEFTEMTQTEEFINLPKVLMIGKT